MTFANAPVSISGRHPMESTIDTKETAQDYEHAHTGPFIRAFERIRPWALSPATRRQWLVFLIFWALTIGGVAYLFIWGFPKLVDHVIDPCIASIEEHLSPVQIGLVVTAGATLVPILLITKAPFVWLAANVFSFPVAFCLILIAEVLTIMMCFGLGRRYLQELALKFLNRYKRTKAVLQSVKSAGQFKVVLLLHLGPIPTNITHYIITFPHAVTFWPALAASFLGTLPGNALQVLFGRNIKGISGNHIPTSQLVYNIVSLVVAIVIVVAGFIYARRALREIEEQALQQEQMAVAAVAAATAQGQMETAAAQADTSSTQDTKATDRASDTVVVVGKCSDGYLRSAGTMHGQCRLHEKACLDMPVCADVKSAKPVIDSVATAGGTAGPALVHAEAAVMQEGSSPEAEPVSGLSGNVSSGMANGAVGHWEIAHGTGGLPVKTSNHVNSDAPCTAHDMAVHLPSTSSHSMSVVMDQNGPPGTGLGQSRGSFSSRGRSSSRGSPRGNKVIPV